MINLVCQWISIDEERYPLNGITGVTDLTEEDDILPYQKYIAEFIGTFVLVFIGCGSAVIAGDYIGYLGISLAFGFAVLAMVYAIGSISGCHINPAISIAMFVAGKMKGKDTGFYIVAQILGGIAAGGVLYGIATGMHGYDIGINGLGQNGFGQETVIETMIVNGIEMTKEVTTGYTMAAAFAAEVVLTFIFLIVIFGATSEKAPKGFAGIPIGIALVFIHLVGIPITGTSVNPARSIGPAIFAGTEALEELWLFIVAPVIGGIIAALVWKFIFDNSPKEVEEIEEEPPRRGYRDRRERYDRHERRPQGRY